jgi:iron(III) transport system substrate-binding protein
LVKLARSEGELTWFTSITASEAGAFVKRFEAKYPGITVRLVRGSTFDLVDRIQREIDQGVPQADVLHVLDPAIFVQLRERGELALYEPPTASAIPPEYKDPGYWTSARLVTIGVAYDAGKIGAANAPKSWSALLHPRWKGKLGLKDAQSAGSAYAQYYFLREKYGVSYWEQMANLSPRIYKTEDDLLKALRVGEIQVAAGIIVRKMEGADKGRLKTVWPDDGVPLVPGPVAILNRAPHPNAAKLFVNYTLSADGQAALRDLLGAYSARPDVKAPDGWPALNTLPLLRPDNGWAEYLQKQVPLRAEYSRLFHGESE